MTSPAIRLEVADGRNVGDPLWVEAFAGALEAASSRRVVVRFDGVPGRVWLRARTPCPDCGGYHDPLGNPT